MNNVVIRPQLIRQYFKHMLRTAFTISIHQKVSHINENTAIGALGVMIIFSAFPVAHEPCIFAAI